MGISDSDRDSEADPVMLLLVACCLLLALRLPGEVTHFVKMAATLLDRNGPRPTNDSALERSPYCLGWLFFRCGIPGLEGSDSRKVVQKHPFSPRGRRPLAPGPPLGGISEDLRAAVPNTKFCTRTSLAQDNNRISALFQCPASAKSPSAGSK